MLPCDTGTFSQADQTCENNKEKVDKIKLEGENSSIFNSSRVS